ncbi:MAG: ERCC4 domain-containing protein [Candidatus Micrarchaeota archaeon]
MTNSVEFNLGEIKAAGKPLIFVDDRELKSETAKTLFKLGASLRPQRLEVSDFILSPRVAIERKTAADFEGSVIDGRLFEQVKNLLENVERPLLCVVGKEFQRLNAKAMRGVVISLVVDFSLPVLFFESEKELAEFLYHVAEKEQLKEHKEQKLRFGRKGATIAEKQQFIVESLPMVGPNAAKKLLEHFGSVEAIFKADEKALQEVDLIGKEKAKEIRNIICTKFGSELV